MKPLATVLRILGWDATNVAVASEISVADPSDDKIDDILNANEVKDEQKED